MRNSQGRHKIAICIAAAVLCTPMMGVSKTPVILSTDVGNEIDDQWAITYLLLSPEFEVQGIISAHAPSLPAPSAHSTYKVLVDVVEHRLGMMTHAPLLEGSSLPLESNKTGQPSAGLQFLLETSKHYSSENRLMVLVIGAATDVASAILADPQIVDRIALVVMSFRNVSKDGGKEYNVQNDPRAWQVILQSGVPVTIGSGDICAANLSLSFGQAAALLGSHGAIGAWLWDEYQTWYFREVKPLRVNDFSKPKVIWDIITVAYLEGMTTQKTMSRPVLSNDLSLQEGSAAAKATWITGVDSKRLWNDFVEKLDAYQRTHAMGHHMWSN
ncbi:MAG: nucleoside hydrolase [Acidobacteriaceae bacterium]|nr:nucleoside hydrolase [Acidobacteriaceae bacterium]